MQRISRLLVGNWDRVLGVLDQSVVSGTRFLTTIMIGRACAPEELGLYAIGFSVVLIALAVHESLVTRPYTIFHGRLSGSARSEYAGSVLVHFGALAVIAASGLALASAAMTAGLGSRQLAPVILVLAGTVPFVLLWEFARRMAFAHLRVRSALILDLGLCAVQLGGLALLASGGWLFAASAHGTVGVACGVVAVSWLLVSRANFKFVRRRIVPEWRRSWSFGRWIGAEQVASASQAALLYWMIAWMLDSKAAGLYAAALAVIAVSNPLVLGMGNILTPSIANAFAAGGISEVRRSVFASTAQLLLPITCFCAAIALFGDRFLVLLFGNEFAEAGAIMPVLALSTLLWAASIPASIGLVTLERADMSFKSALANLAVTAVFAPLAMAKWGLLGAAWAWTGGIAIATSIVWVAVSHTWSRPSVVVTVAAKEAAAQ